MLVLGRSGSGKSTLVRALFDSAAPPKLVIDPADSNLTAVPGAWTSHDVARIVAEGHEHPIVRFVPRDPHDLDAYDEVYAWARANYPRMVWADEVEFVAPVNRCPTNVRGYIVNGRKFGLGHLGCHTRPREIYKGLVANAMHLFLFHLPDPEDRRYVAGQTGLAPAELDTYMGQLPEFGFLWWHPSSRTLRIMDPLQAR